MLPPSRSTTGVNDPRLARARAWSAYNFAPTRPIPFDLYPSDGPSLQRIRAAAEPSDEAARRLADYLKSLETAGRDQALAPAPARPTTTRDRYIAGECFAAIGTRNANSFGPYGYPWQLVSLSATGGTGAADAGMAVTATPDDASGSGRLADGTPLVDGNADAASTVPPPYWQPSASTAISYHWTGPSLIAPEGYFLTIWSHAGAATFNAHVAAVIREIITSQPLSAGPDLSLVQYRLQRAAPRPPAIRTPTPQPPAAVRVTSLGFSRIIPWTFLDPALKREYITNLYNGQPTPGLMPV